MWDFFYRESLPLCVGSSYSDFSSCLRQIRGKSNLSSLLSSAACRICVTFVFGRARGVGGLPLRRRCLPIHASHAFPRYIHTPYTIHLTPASNPPLRRLFASPVRRFSFASTTSWQIEKRRPARDLLNADVAHAECSVCLVIVFACLSVVYTFVIPSDICIPLDRAMTERRPRDDRAKTK